MLKAIILCLSAFFFYAERGFALDTSSLIKVNAENKANCVEYYTYKGELYCSTTAQNTESPVDPDFKNYETQNIVFDDRPWQAVWGKKTSDITTVEYVPSGEKIENWHELITSQFLPNVQINPMQYVARIVQQLKKAGFDPLVDIIEQTPKQVIFEFRIVSPENHKQDELQIVTQKDDGLYILHYVIKEADMGEANRTKWIENLRRSR